MMILPYELYSNDNIDTKRMVVIATCYLRCGEGRIFKLWLCLEKLKSLQQVPKYYFNNFILRKVFHKKEK